MIEILMQILFIFLKVMKLNISFLAQHTAEESVV